MSGLRVALSLFTVLPAGPVTVDRSNARRAVLWLPVVGVILGLLASAGALLAWRGHTQGSPSLAAVLALVMLAVLTRGLHLDGLADLADGLGSGQPADRALRIMRRSDIGPFGIAALVLVLLVQTVSAATILAASTRPLGVVDLTVAAVTGRVAVTLASARGVPAARPDGFGALVAGSVGWFGRGCAAVAAFVTGEAAAALAGATSPELWWLAGAILGALAASTAIRGHAVARLGGVTGDVFGAVVEIATGTFFLLTALGSVWG
jgi:adenosylcobinamide-GDP ribazoletransferase